MIKFVSDKIKLREEIQQVIIEESKLLREDIKWNNELGPEKKIQKVEEPKINNNQVVASNDVFNDKGHLILSNINLSKLANNQYSNNDFLSWAKKWKPNYDWNYNSKNLSSEQSKIKDYQENVEKKVQYLNDFRNQTLKKIRGSYGAQQSKYAESLLFQLTARLEERLEKDYNERWKGLRDEDKYGNLGRPTKSKNQIKVLADKIFTAVDGKGTYEDDIIDVFKSLGNKADFGLLNTSFGTRKVRSGIWGKSDLTGDLSRVLNSELSQSDIKKINTILQSKGSTFRF
jgi:hypothetical protein